MTEWVHYRAKTNTQNTDKNVLIFLNKLNDDRIFLPVSSYYEYKSSEFNSRILVRGTKIRSLVRLVSIARLK